MAAHPMAPLVSVIVPTHNRGYMIRETLLSVVAQVYRPIELIVVDDGSNDDTSEILESFRDTAVESGIDFQAMHQKQQGAPAARNLGLRHSRGDYVQFLDSDDLLHPQRFQQCVGAFEENRGFDFLFTGWFSFVDGPVDWENFEHCVAVERETPEEKLIKGGVTTVRSFYRRECCERMGPWDESMSIWQDREYNSRLLAIGARIGEIGNELAAYRKHEGERISDKFGSPQMVNSLDRMVLGLHGVSRRRDAVLKSMGSLFVNCALAAAKRKDYDTAERALDRARRYLQGGRRSAILLTALIAKGNRPAAFYFLRMAIRAWSEGRKAVAG